MLSPTGGRQLEGLTPQLEVIQLFLDCFDSICHIFLSFLPFVLVFESRRVLSLPLSSRLLMVLAINDGDFKVQFVDELVFFLLLNLLLLNLIFLLMLFLRLV